MSQAPHLPMPSLDVLDTAQPIDFTHPAKKIHVGQDVSTFLTTKAFHDITVFLLQLNRSLFPSLIHITPEKTVVRKWDSDSSDVSFSIPVVQLRALLDNLKEIISQAPPDPGPRRFGNISFRRWYQLVEARVPDLLQQYLPNIPAPLRSAALPELSFYLLGAFGSAQRLDYGSGHELSFLAFLGCIWKLGGFVPSDPGEQERGIVIGVIQPYLQLVRRLIKTYNLEPAGSHGVWGLDDHSFIPYLFGSAQYGPPVSITDQAPTAGSREGAPNPGDVCKRSLVDSHRASNMYFAAIGFVHDVKSGPFWEHSPMLYDISGVRAGWGKINKGMIKMYNAEVLSKFPVVQHFHFGALFSWDQDPNATPAPVSVHTSNQPARDSQGSSSFVDPNSLRGQSAESTKAPWVTKSTSIPGTAAGTPTSRSNRSAATATDKIPSAIMRHPTLENAARDLNDKNGASLMPPPTRAPWAKPP